ncbi:hypothetical protein SELMODRAFT_418346 [Selaginella moellendorffii]|uniref:Uncharacterized protein n=1 Tax=Selaginella moellendorffii TaxID=88036 RepID=D8S5F2_SELML|nr:hypothetical protein SELMODRAFT_418346 [Selaginella moellendorffii]
MQPVKIVSAQLVRPSHPSRATTKRFELTGFDRIMQYVPYQKRILFYKSFEEEQEDLTVALQQSLAEVTKFGCGGLSIGVSGSHQIMDGVSFWHFLNSWAEFSRTGKIAHAPQVTFGYEERDPTQAIKEVPRKPSKCSERSQELGLKHYKMDKDMIEKLKREAPGTTTFEVVCAHFWKKVVVAKGLEGSSSCNFMVLVDCRGRIKSLPSKFYFGNAIWSSVATATVGDLARNPVSHAAALLHDAITRFDADKAEEKFHQRRRPQAQQGSQVLGSKPCFTLVAVESPKQPVFECDFGFGRPVGMSFGANDLHDGKIYLFPLAPGSGSGVSVTVVLDKESLGRML